MHRELWLSTIPPPSAPTLNVIYAGSGGLNVNVARNTTLTAGTLSSTAAADLDSFTTGTLTAEGLGDVADALANSSNPTLAKAFSEGGLGRILLEAAGNAGVAALGGGNVAAAAGGTLAGGLATDLAAELDLFPNDPALAALATNILESGAGALGGVIGGATTGGNTAIDAGAASLINLYNQDADLNKKMKALDAEALGRLMGPLTPTLVPPRHRPKAPPYLMRSRRISS